MVKRYAQGGGAPALQEHHEGYYVSYASYKALAAELQQQATDSQQDWEKAQARVRELEAALRRADAQIGATPHGDNCFVSAQFPGTQCCCGKESALEAITSALETEAKS